MTLDLLALNEFVEMSTLHYFCERAGVARQAFE
jgi:hypothetical protein